PSLVLVLTVAGFWAPGQAAVRAQDSKKGQRPDELAVAARAVLTTHCRRCHGENGAAEGGFNSVTDRSRLVVRKRIVPGDIGNSKLLQRIIAGEMPPPEEKTRPSAADIATLTKWVKAGAPDWAPATPRKFITVDEEARRVREDRAQVKTNPG